MSENNFSSRCSSEVSEDDNREIHSCGTNSSSSVVDNNINNDNNNISGNSNKNYRCPDSICKQNALSA